MRVWTEEAMKERVCPFSFNSSMNTGFNCIATGDGDEEPQCLACVRIQMKYDQGEKWYTCLRLQPQDDE